MFRKRKVATEARSPQQGPNPPPTQAEPGSLGRFLWWFAVGVFLIAPVAGLAWLYVSRPAVPPPPEVAFDGTDPEVRDFIETARKSLLDEPRSPDAWGRYGMILRVHSFATEADRCFAEAQRLNPQDARWPYYLGLHAESGQADGVPRGLTHFHRAVQIGHPDPLYRSTARLRLAEALLDRQQFDEAEAIFREDLLETPNNPRAAVGLGLVGAGRGDFSMAQANLTIAAADPSSRQLVASQLAALARRGGDLAAATRHLEEAARYGPDIEWPDPFVQDCLALQVGLKARLREVAAMERAGQPRDAIAILLKLAQTHPSALIYVKLAATLGKVGDTASAELYLREALGLDPNSEQAHHLLGVTLFFLAKTRMQTDRTAALSLFRESVEHFRQSLSRKPDHAEAHQCLGQALFALGEKDEAIKHLHLAITCRPEQYEGHLYLGEILAEVGEKDQALQSLRTAAQLALQNDPRPRALIDRLTKGKN